MLTSISWVINPLDSVWVVWAWFSGWSYLGSPIKVYNLEGIFIQPIKDVHKCPEVSNGCYTRCYIYRHCLHIPFWQVSLKFNKSLWELNAPFFQKISIWQEILFELLERRRKSSLCHNEFVLLMYSCLNHLEDNMFIVLQKTSSGNQC